MSVDSPRSTVRTSTPPVPAKRGGVGNELEDPEPAADHQALGRCRGGLTTKVHLACDGRGLPLAGPVTPGNVNDSTAGSRTHEILQSLQYQKDRTFSRAVSLPRSSSEVNIEPPGVTWPAPGQPGVRPRRDQVRVVVRVRGRSRRRLSVAALACYKPGERSRLIYRPCPDARPDGRKSFSWKDYRDLIQTAHQQLGGPIVLIRDNLNTRLTAGMRRYIAERDWLTVYQLPPYAPDRNPAEGIWSALRRTTTANRAFTDPHDLITAVR